MEASTWVRRRAATVKSHLGDAARALHRGAFLELNHDPSRAVLVLGSGRSGTTWLAESIARQTTSRLMFEPFHPLWSPRRDRLRLFLDGNDPGEPMASTATAVLTGRVRKFQVDQVVVSRFPRARVVKDIHTTNLLPWFAERFPEVPVVFALRHPIATALSRQRFGDFFGLAAYLDTTPGREDAERSPVASLLPTYDRYCTDSDPLVRLVAEWCIENAYPLSRIGATEALLTFYETATVEPVSELTRIGDFCAGALGSQRGYRLEALRKPSTKDWFGTAATAHSSQDWIEVLSRWTTEVPEVTTRSCLEVLEAFGMDAYYGAEPLPRQQPSRA
jgi:hypothetical protein